MEGGGGGGGSGPSLSYHLSLRGLFCLFLCGYLVSLYVFSVFLVEPEGKDVQKCLTAGKISWVSFREILSSGFPMRSYQNLLSHRHKLENCCFACCREKSCPQGF